MPSSVSAGEAERQHVVDQAEDDERGDDVRPLAGAEADQDRRLQHADAARRMADDAGDDGDDEDDEEDREAGDDIRRQEHVEGGGSRGDVDGADQHLHEDAAAAGQRQRPAEQREAPLARRKPDDEAGERGEDHRADQTVDLRVELVEQRHADGIDEEGRADQGDEAEPEGEEGDADDAADIGGVEPDRRIEPVAHRTADEDVEADGVGNGVAHHAGHGREGWAHLAGGDLAHGHDVVERHGREADGSEQGRQPHRRPRRVALMALRMRVRWISPEIWWMTQRGDEHQHGADERPQHARLDDAEEPARAGAFGLLKLSSFFHGSQPPVPDHRSRPRPDGASSSCCVTGTRTRLAWLACRVGEGAWRRRRARSLLPKPGVARCSPYHIAPCPA